MSHTRERMDSCLHLIKQVSQQLANQEVNPAIVEQLDRLDKLLNLVDHREVSEHDMARIEKATNALMGELEVLYQHRDLNTALWQEFH